MPHIPRIHTHRAAHGPCWCEAITEEKREAECLARAKVILKPLQPVPMQLREFRALILAHDNWFFAPVGDPKRDTDAAAWRKEFQKAKPLVSQAMMASIELGLHKAAFESH